MTTKESSPSSQEVKEVNSKPDMEDGELPNDSQKPKEKRNSKPKDKRSKSRERRDGHKDRDRRSRERRDDRRSRRDKSRSRERRRDRSKDRRRRDSRDRKRSRSGENGRKRARSTSRKRDGKTKEQKTEKAPPVVVVPVTPEQRTEEEEYKKRVEEQLELIESDVTAEQEAEQRKKRREQLLQKFKKEDSAIASPKEPEPEQKTEQKTEQKEQAHAPKRNHDSVNGFGELDAPVPNGTDVSENTPKNKDGKGYDMFSDSPSKLVVPLAGKVANPNVMDGFDDSEGYYVFRLGDILDSRYRVVASQGRGVFSTVLRVTDTAFANRELVVKVIRNNETMLKAGLKELDFLKDISKKDPEGKKHCVKLISSFEHRNHLCLVFEPMHLNLREVLRKFGGVGLNVNAVRTYAKQMLIALKHLKDCGILHGDLKPDNILVNEAMNQVKLCDFGSAGRITECEITPYLVSRFYRAPEIMLGLKYNDQADMWSLGCVLYELYTGKILFSGKDNNEMLKLMMEVKGAFSKKCLKKGEFHGKHFDQDFLFQQKRIDSLTGQELTEKVAVMRPTVDLIGLLTQASTQGPLSEKDRRKVTQLGDLLLKIFELDPSKRVSVVDCLKHPFIKDD